MTRFLQALLLAVLAIGTAQGQGSKYTPLPAGESDPEALKRLAAMLGGNTSKPPPIDPKMMELFQKFMKDTENDPAARQRMIDAARQQVQDNPEQFKKQFRQQNPDTSPEDLKKLMQGLGKPGDPPPELPKPGNGLTKPVQLKPLDKPESPTVTKPITPNQQNPNNPQSQLPKPQPKQANSEQVQSAVQMWEQTVGPIDSTPAVKDAIVDLFGNGKGGMDGKPFWDSPEFKGDSSAPNSGFWKFLNGGNGTGGSSWKSPSWMKNLTMSTPSAPTAPKSSFKGPSAPSFGSMGGVGLAGLGTVGTVILILVVVAIVGFLIWKFLPMIKEARNRRLQPLPGAGPWPVDPRTIRDREGLVLAFEYLSILVCGNGAVVWNHLTIAEALRDALPEKEHLAEPLARLYAVARYTPLNEEIPASAYAEARHCLCQLAGVSEV